MYTSQQPFHQITSPFAVQLHVVKGNTPQRPQDDECHGHPLIDELWFLMTSCWKRDPLARPDMQTTVFRIRDIVSIIDSRSFARVLFIPGLIISVDVL
jgi:hypothetical protein